MTGKIKMFDKANGFGFVTGTDGQDYYTKLAGLTPEEKSKAGQDTPVSFDLQEGLRGQEAINVKLI